MNNAKTTTEDKRNCRIGHINLSDNDQESF